MLAVIHIKRLSSVLTLVGAASCGGSTSEPQHPASLTGTYTLTMVYGMHVPAAVTPKDHRFDGSITLMPNGGWTSIEHDSANYSGDLWRVDVTTLNGTWSESLGNLTLTLEQDPGVIVNGTIDTHRIVLHESATRGDYQYDR